MQRLHRSERHETIHSERADGADEPPDSSVPPQTAIPGPAPQTLSLTKWALSPLSQLLAEQPPAGAQRGVSDTRENARHG